MARGLAGDGTTEEAPRFIEVIEPETVAHWWCRRCGRWEVCNDSDLCIECAYMVAARTRGAGKGRRADSDSSASTGGSA